MKDGKLIQVIENERIKILAKLKYGYSESDDITTRQIHRIMNRNVKQQEMYESPRLRTLEFSKPGYLVATSVYGSNENFDVDGDDGSQNEGFDLKDEGDF